MSTYKNGEAPRRAAVRARSENGWNRAALALAAALFVGAALQLAGVAAQSPDPISNSASIPSAREVLSRYVDAIGGQPIILQRLSYHGSGRFELPEGKTGALEFYGRQPHKFWVQVEIPKVGKYLRATDGQTMWHFNPQSGYRMGEDWEYHARQGLKKGDDEQQSRLTEMLDGFGAVRFGAVRLDGNGAVTGTVARASFAGRACFELQYRRRPNQAIHEFFEAASGLRLGATYPGTNAETFLFSDYKDFSGVKFATSVTRMTGGRTNDVFTIRSVEFVDVPDSRFVMPIHVPEWPQGWNEIDEAYPPGFAKGSLPWPWKGEHRRWFSPGFGRTNDMFFWSYVVFNALEGDTLNFAAEVQDALHRYDASLYGKAFAPEKIKVTVGLANVGSKLGHEVTRRSVVIDGFDAESSKKELRTYLETFRWYCPMANRTAFLILRSPRPYSPADEVWKVLHQFSDGMVCHQEVLKQTAQARIRSAAK